MYRLKGSWNDVRGKGFFVAVAIACLASIITFGNHADLGAKAPGETHCYKDVCHRVYTLAETRRMVGDTVDLHATHYDHPSVDKMNVGQYTSSGEEFDAGNPARVSASNFPDGTELLLWHPVTGKASHVRVNDFGPFWGARTLDVTRRVAEDLGFAKAGVAVIKVTVLWSPLPEDTKFRKGRVYPPSMGLLGTVESTQHASVVQRLLATAALRNGFKGPVPPLPDAEAPGFRIEAVEDAKVAALTLDAGIAALATETARIRVAGLSSDLDPPTAPRYPEPPAFRVEGETEALIIAGLEAARAEAARAEVARVEAARQEAARVAAAQVPPPLPAASGATPAPVATVASAIAAATSGSRPTIRDTAADTSGRDAANRPTVVAEAPVLRVPPTIEPRAQQAVDAIVETAASVSVARASLWDLHGPRNAPLLWLGVGLMLSSLWGAAALMRAKSGKPAQARAQVAGTPRKVANGADVVETYAETAPIEHAPAPVAANRNARIEQSELMRMAREIEARELADQAAAAHASALREAEELEALARQRAAEATAELEAAQRRAADHKAAAAATARREAERRAAEARAELQERERLENARREAEERAAAADPVLRAALAREKSARDLAAALSGKPGAERFWGNTIIAEARLDGTAKSGSPLRIDGIVEGSIYAPVVLVSLGAEVRGNIAAETIVVLGAVSGTLSGRNVTVAASAQVEGEIYYQTMSIDPQAHCDVRFARLPSDSHDPALAALAVHRVA